MGKDEYEIHFTDTFERTKWRVERVESLIERLDHACSFRFLSL